MQVMNEVSDARQIARESASLALDGAAWSITLLTDGEALANAVAPQADHLYRYLQQDQTAATPLLESLLPDIRAFATLLASTRRQPQGSPARFTDATDWLAARIAVLELSHVAVTLPELTQLDEANRRLKLLSEQLQLKLPSAAPVLLTAPEATPGVLRGWSRQRQSGMVGTVHGMQSMLMASRLVAQQCRQRLQPFWHGLQAARRG
ncbi:hypothetical protein EAY64_00265 [Aquitalea palustris]|uniref:Uncharacterized protein n=2 Tax=Aquitalea palustris TaxID=2480983 RepID=A0A454JP40_9NEIS|nr:hypothetical protein EAY64_00265 [Aquitalea palustris]